MNRTHKLFNKNIIILFFICPLFLFSSATKAEFYGFKIFLPFLIRTDSTSNDNVYYLSPSGSDSNTGTKETQAWATFNRAWLDLYPGDTLILLDGIYYQTLNPNKRNGEAGKPITIRAKNDGKAIIDGEYKRIPIKLGNTWPGPIGNYFILEGLIAKNSNGAVVTIDGGKYNILRRISAYNANTDTNSAVIGVLWESSQYNLIEDCVAAGTGRKMLYTFKGENNIFRRCFVDWQSWDGREWHDCWPWGDGIEIYNGSFNIIENSITYSKNPTWAINVMANSLEAKAVGNKVLGSIALSAGIKEDSSVMEWGNIRPQPTNHTCVRNFDWPGQRVGFMVYGQGEIRDNLWQDIFSWGNAGLGLSINPGTEYHPNTGNNRIIRAAIFNNGLDNPIGPWPGRYGGLETDALFVELSKFDSIENSYIEKIFVDWPDYPNGERNLTSMTGEGARLTHRYIDGELTDVPLWPWPMEERIQNELGISVTEIITGLIFNNNGSEYGMNDDKINNFSKNENTIEFGKGIGNFNHRINGCNFYGNYLRICPK
jgi:hypothetical protein